MSRDKERNRSSKNELAKAPTGITGLDEITGGGLPRGRPTLVCGAAGCGKTVLAMEFLVRGALQFNEPGVFMAFEETAEDLARNFASMGFDLPELVASKKLHLDHVYIERSEIDETGEYDLEGLFVRLGHAIDLVGAKRVVLDTIEAIFSGFANVSILRAELRRLFRWLKERGVTAIITGERGDATLTRHGLEEYVSDCVLVLDHRVEDLTATRRLRIPKYRGSRHGTDEVPFLIGPTGFSVIPITSLGLDHAASSERIPTGIPRLDAMLGGGYYRGTSILVSGMAGTGKTSIAASFVEAACRRGERVAYFNYEEAPAQILRNMRSIGLDLEPWVRKGLLAFRGTRSTNLGLETHLVNLHSAVEEVKPAVVVLDPITSLQGIGNPLEVKSMLARAVDYFKARGITGLLTSLNHSGAGALSPETSDAEVSSLMDTWLLLRNLEHGGERNRGLFVLKSRGMAHSNQVREFVLTDHGIELVEVYSGPEGVLAGSARLAQKAKEREAALAQQQELQRRQRTLEQRRQAVEAQIAVLQSQLQAEEDEFSRFAQQNTDLGARQEQDRLDMSRSRSADAADATKRSKTRK